MNYVTHLLSSAEMSIFSMKIGNFCYIKQYSYKIHINK